MAGGETEGVFVEEAEVADDHELKLCWKRRKKHNVCCGDILYRGECSL